ncbi:MAG TPA: cytochrome c3 family protein [Candidatus Acidoferrales bacterium]|nr:cytochrome c3 family protein [Candidatus Acidoferrales bacterium]
MAMRLRLLTLSTALFVLALCFGTIQSAHPRISPTAIPAKSGPAIKSNFVGSETCRKCHEELYQSWKQTRMANVVRDPKKDPQAVLGDFSHPDPNLTFDLSQVAFVYGSRWKQRYFTRRGDDYFVLPAQWDIKHNRWLPYHVADGSDWWTKFYPTGNFERPTGPLCDGCHSLNYNLETKQVTEWNVACEKCHGPGGAHSEHPTRQNIVNPARLDAVRANDTCMQCHSQGRPLTVPTQGKYVDWPVGYLPGDRLADFWNLEENRLGTETFYHYADGTAHKNRMQGNDFTQSVMYHRGMRCFNCHDVHSNKNTSNLIKTGNDLCMTCHGPDGAASPAVISGPISDHTHHAAASAGSQCTACHMPKIEQTLGDNMVSAHTFQFISPRLTEQFKIPNPCTTCHTDKSNQWALDQLKTWQSTSPWRVAR